MEVGATRLTSPPIAAVMLPGDGQRILPIESQAGNFSLRNQIDQRRAKVEYELCDCSVFQECYLSALSTLLAAVSASANDAKTHRNIE